MNIVDYSTEIFYIHLERSFISYVYHISKRYISLFRFICFSKFTHIGTCQLCLLHFFSLNHDNDGRKVMWWKKCILDFKNMILGQTSFDQLSYADFTVCFANIFYQLYTYIHRSLYVIMSLLFAYVFRKSCVYHI